MKQPEYSGSWVTMVTPFRDGKIDYPAVEKLVEWYLAHGVDGIFAVCQSSEMFFLSLQERVELGRFVVQQAAKRVPVVVSGHISDTLEEQEEELRQMAQVGADAVILVSNRLAAADEDDDVWKQRLMYILEKIPDCVFGIYECPYPYKRLLSPELLHFCGQTGRIRFLKDTCCDAQQIRQRLEAVKGSDLCLFNANTATLLDSLQAGAAGYCGVMANFHPELYHWLAHNWHISNQAQQVQDFATVAAWAERIQYPKSAKYHLTLSGVPMQLDCRNLADDCWGTLQETEIKALFDLWGNYRSHLR